MAEDAPAGRDQAVKVQRDGPVAVVTLDDPDHRNALSRPLVDELICAFASLDDDPRVRAVVVTATPPVFCAGGSLADLVARDRQPLQAIYESFLRIAACPVPTVAAVTGPVIGAGLNVVLACDVAIAAESATFDARFLRVSIHPGGGMCARLQRAIGSRRAAAMILLGDKLTAREAVDAGLAWQRAPDGDVLAQAITVAERIAQTPRELLVRTKVTLRTSEWLSDQEAAVAIEQSAQEWSMRQPEFARTVAAIRERISHNPL